MLEWILFAIFIGAILGGVYAWATRKPMPEDFPEEGWDG